MPRKSVASLSVATVRPLRPRLVPTATLAPEVRKIFEQIISSVPAEHFNASDLPLIESYARAIVLTRRAYEAVSKAGLTNGLKPSAALAAWEKCSKVEVALSARLRLSPQHRYNAKSSKLSGPPPSVYDLLRRDNDGDED